MKGITRTLTGALATAALLAFGQGAAAQVDATYGACVTIPDGSEHRYLLGGRDEFYDAIRWEFVWDTSRGASGLGRLKVETKTKAALGGSWITSVRYNSVRAGAAEEDGLRTINYNGGKVRGTLWNNTASVQNFAVNVPGRLKFAVSGHTTTFDHSGCP